MESARTNDTAPEDAGGTSKPAMASDPVISNGGPVVPSLLSDLGATAPKPQRWRGGWLVTGVILLAILVALAAGFIGGLSYNALVTNTVYAQFAEPDQDIGDVCAGAIVKQENYMQANGPAVINMVATIYDKAGVVIPPTARNYWLAVPNQLEVRDVFTWEAPELPPDSYIRVVGANTESVRPPAISKTLFSVVNCDANGKATP